MRDGGFRDVLVRADFAGDGAFDVADDAFAAFDLGANDAEAIKGNDRLLWLLGLLRASRGLLLGLAGAGDRR